MRFVKKCLLAVFAVALMALPASAMADPTPLAYYPFNDCSVVSSTANAYNSGSPALTLHNGASDNGPGPDCSLNVNSSLSSYDDFAQANGSDDAIFRGMSDLTLSSDVIVSVSDNFWQTVALQDKCGTIGSNSASCIGYALFLQKDSNGGKVPAGYVRYTCGESSSLVEVTGEQLGEGQHSLALTAEHGIGAHVRLYVDGELVDTAQPPGAGTSCPAIDSGTSAGRFTVGGELITGSIDGFGYMNPNEVAHAFLDNLRVYDTVLTATEIGNILP